MSSTEKAQQGFIHWKKQTQKEMKQAGYKMTYKIQTNQFQLYPSLEKDNSYVDFYVTFYKMPRIVIDFNRFRPKDFEETVKQVISVIGKIIEYFAKNEIVHYEIEVKQNYKFGKDSYNAFIEEMKEITNSISCYHVQYAKFVDVKTFSKLEPLFEMEKESKKYYQEKNKIVNTEFINMYQTLGGLPNCLTLFYKDVVDRNIMIKVLEEEEKYQVDISSKIHTKTLVLKHINLNVLEEELENFISEERLIELFTGPKINSTIEKFLKEIISKNSLKVAIDELFDFFISQDLTVEEMTEKSVLRWSDNPLLRNNEYTQKEKKAENKNGEYTTRYFTTFILSMYDRFLLIGYKDEWVNSWSQSSTAKEKDLFLFRSYEKALQQEKEWLLKKL